MDAPWWKYYLKERPVYRQASFQSWLQPLGRVTLYQDRIVIDARVEKYELLFSEIEHFQFNAFQVNIEHHNPNVIRDISVNGIFSSRAIRKAIMQHRLPVRIIWNDELDLTRQAKPAGGDAWQRASAAALNGENKINCNGRKDSTTDIVDPGLKSYCWCEPCRILWRTDESTEPGCP